MNDTKEKEPKVMMMREVKPVAEPIYICIPTTPDRRARLQELLTSIQLHTKDIIHRVVIYENEDGGWVPAVHNLLEKYAIDGYVVLLGSDVVVQDGWLSTLWARFIKAFPDGSGAAQPFDEIHGGQLCQHPLAHSDTIKKYLHRGYTHNFSDNEMTDRLLKDGKYLYVPEAKIEHKHFVNGKAPKDATYEVVFNKETYAKDQQLYITRKQNGFKD